MTCMSNLMPSIDHLKHLQIPLLDILSATNGFSKENLIGAGGYGPVYQGMSEKHGHIAVKRLFLGEGHRQGDNEFKTEIASLLKFKHENIASLIGFCDEDGEMIVVYKYESKGSLDKRLNNEDLTWTQRVRICLDAARGLRHLHHGDGGTFHDEVIHRDIKSSNILLDENLKAKISDFGLSRPGPANTQSSFVISNPCGTPGYIDPDYYNAGYLTPKADVFSFGVVLCEVLCGRNAINKSYNDERQSLTVLFRKHYSKRRYKGRLDKIIPSYLQKDMNKSSLQTFAKIAYECLKNEEERPTMKQVVKQLEKALQYQEALKIPLQDIKSACNNFSGENFIARDVGARVFQGISEKHGPVFIKRFDSGQGLGDHHFKLELLSFKNFEHRDKVSFLGFCKEDGENIHVYKCAINPSLDQYASNRFLSWEHRLMILIELKYGCDFELTSDLRTYIRPAYNNYLQQKPDVYSVGVTLSEVLTGRLADKDDPQGLPNFVREHYKKKTLHSIIPPYLLKQINPDSLATYTDIAFQCLNNVDERPTMKQVVEQLQKALDQQLQSCSSSHQNRSTGLDLKATPTETDNQLMINLLEPTSLNLSEHIAK